jgi:hypothetical protein
LHADAALNAMADAGLKPADIDGIAHYLGLTPKWVDGTAVGGCSFMIHVRHAAAAIAAGLCKTVLITHGESGRSGVGRTRNVTAPTSLVGQFEQPYGPMGPPTLFNPGIALMSFPVAPAKAGVQGERRGPGSLGSRLRGNDEVKAQATGDGLGLSRRRRHIRCLRHHHHVEPAAAVNGATLTAEAAAGAG